MDIKHKADAAVIMCSDKNDESLECGKDWTEVLNEPVEQSSDSPYTKGVVNRQKVLDILNRNIASELKLYKELQEKNADPVSLYTTKAIFLRLTACRGEIVALPEETQASVQPEAKTGKWLIRKLGANAQCPNCHKYFSDVYDMEWYDAYCRSCGLQMVGIQKTE